MEALSSRDGAGLPAPPEPPDELVAWLGERNGLLAQVRHVLLEWEPPRWESDLGGSRPPLPSVLGHLDLARLLVADALVAGRAGDPACADEDLRAAWALAGSLASRADLRSAVLAIAEARLVLDALRVLRSPDGVATGTGSWLDRLDATPFREGLLDGTRAWALGWIVLAERGPARPGGEGEDEGLLEQVLGALARPMASMMASREARSLLPPAERLAQPAGCTPPEPRPPGLTDWMLDGFDGRPRRPPWWYLVARADRLALEAELTLLVLALVEEPGPDAAAPCDVLASEDTDAATGAGILAGAGAGAGAEGEHDRLAPCASAACPEVTWAFERRGDLVIVRAQGAWHDDRDDDDTDDRPLEAVIRVSRCGRTRPGVDAPRSP